MWSNSKALFSLLFCQGLTHVRRVELAHIHTQTRAHTHMNGMASFSSTCGSKVNRASHRREDKQGTPSDSDCSALLEKTREFFQICDIEGKGFITRRDMQVRMLGRASTWFVIMPEVLFVKKNGNPTKCLESSGFPGIVSAANHELIELICVCSPL